MCIVDSKPVAVSDVVSKASAPVVFSPTLLSMADLDMIRVWETCPTLSYHVMTALDMPFDQSIRLSEVLRGLFEERLPPIVSDEDEVSARQALYLMLVEKGLASGPPWKLTPRGLAEVHIGQRIQSPRNYSGGHRRAQLSII